MRRFNLYIGEAASAWVLAISVVLAELIAPFKTFLQTTFTHHWVGKVVLVTLAFLLFGFLSKEKSSDEKTAWYSVIGSLSLILLFYLVIYLVE